MMTASSRVAEGRKLAHALLMDLELLVSDLEFHLPIIEDAIDAVAHPMAWNALIRLKRDLLCLSVETDGTGDIPECVQQLQMLLSRNPDLRVETAVDYPNKYAPADEKALIACAEQVLDWASKFGLTAAVGRHGG